LNGLAARAAPDARVDHGDFELFTKGLVKGLLKKKRPALLHTFRGHCEVVAECHNADICLLNVADYIVCQVRGPVTDAVILLPWAVGWHSDNQVVVGVEAFRRALHGQFLARASGASGRLNKGLQAAQQLLVGRPVDGFGTMLAGDLLWLVGLQELFAARTAFRGWLAFPLALVAQLVLRWVRPSLRASRHHAFDVLRRQFLELLLAFFTHPRTGATALVQPVVQLAAPRVCPCVAATADDARELPVPAVQEETVALVAHFAGELALIAVFQFVLELIVAVEHPRSLALIDLAGNVLILKRLEGVEAGLAHAFGVCLDVLPGHDVLELLVSIPVPGFVAAMHSAGDGHVLQTFEVAEAGFTEPHRGLTVFTEHLVAFAPRPRALTPLHPARDFRIFDLLEIGFTGLAEAAWRGGMSLFGGLELGEAVPVPRVRALSGGTDDLLVGELGELGEALVTHAIRAGRFPLSNIVEGIRPGELPDVVASPYATADIFVGEEIPEATETRAQCSLLRLTHIASQGNCDSDLCSAV